VVYQLTQLFMMSDVKVFRTL